MHYGAAERIERLIGDLGDIGDPVKHVLRAVPRHLFIPPVGLAFPVGEPAHLIDRDAAPDAWWRAVYTDTSIVTQLDDGATVLRDVVDQNGGVDLGRGADYTSSASAPSTVADLLELLDPAPGHRVLEIGTGTGWTAALLSHLVGEGTPVGEGNVTSIEVDPIVAEQAAKNLAAVGMQPRLIIGDGAAGCSEVPSYDRVHVTCGVRCVPYAWVEQTRPGGVIVLPYCPGFGTNHALRLVVGPDGTAHGRFPGFASYMLMRSQRVPEDEPARSPDDERRFTTPVDPRAIAFAPAGADLAISALTGLHSLGRRYEDEGVYRLWVSDPGAPSRWALATWRRDAVEFEVYQVGDRPVWEEAVNAYFRWVAWGEPDRSRFGMTIMAGGRQVWLDTPDHVIG
ncbi:methyltransferase domain-containing protein [Streptosporangium soli]|nr:protein-L-isoaspartate(D-aspartate) O-methyltransferase [Streptosporangium sp. KLBMP 9127]